MTLSWLIWCEHSAQLYLSDAAPMIMHGLLTPSYPQSKASQTSVTLASAPDYSFRCVHSMLSYNPHSPSQTKTTPLFVGHHRHVLMMIRWVKAMEGKMGLRVCKPGDPTLMRTLESCIRLGHPLLVEEMGGTLEPQLLPLLEGTVSSQGHRRFIRLGGSDVDYDVNFKLYMTTKLANPHYLPEVCIATNLINFTVTQEVSGVANC